MIKNKKIDNGREFDFGRTSEDYAKYRDIYPAKFYQKILSKGLCADGQRVLDIGTGTGVLPRNLYNYGAKFTGIDISANQIEQAKLLAQNADMRIDFQCVSAEDCEFDSGSFDVATACQCFTYFDHNRLAPKIYDLLKYKGKFVITYMAWLPYEDEIAGKSEELVLKYNPVWSGRGETRRNIEIPQVYDRYFDVQSREIFDLLVPFSRASWNGRMKTCRGVQASLALDEVESFEKEHLAMLEKLAPENFEILHYAAIAILTKK